LFNPKSAIRNPKSFGSITPNVYAIKPRMSFMAIPFSQNRKPGPVGQVRDDRLCHRSNLFMGFPPEADQVSGVRKSMIYELRDLGIEKFVYR
jgi:hypothetical protein